MIISRTPFRVSLVGGGTDFPAWYNTHNGAVIGFALNKYCWVQVRLLPPYFTFKHRIVWSKIELIRQVAEIEHPAAKAALQEFWTQETGIELHHTGDLPARSGLGSSSSFSVGLINALCALRGRRIDKAELAAEAIRLEQDVIGEAVGSQDQVWASYGGLNRIDFSADEIRVSPLMVPSDRRQNLMSYFILFFTGFQRTASEIETEKIRTIVANGPQLLTIRRMVDDAEAIITDPIQDLALLGELLHSSWIAKRSLANAVSNPDIDAIYTRARAAGAIGGKLLGAGGGGFFLFLVRPADRANLIAALPELISVNPGIDRWGSRIVLYEPNGL